MSASHLHKKITIDKLPPRPMEKTKMFSAPSKQKTHRDYTPMRWKKYWDSRRFINIDNDRFCVYECGSSGPVLVLLHGGGFSALTWSLFSSTITNLVECRTMAFDIRGHGDTHTSDDSDLSLDRLSNDVHQLVSTLYPSDTKIILIGHSMGGAIAVDVAHKQLIPSLVALIVIDVVEGSAMDALSSMSSVLRGRPKQFPSFDKAIEWSFRCGHIRNLESAKVSMVGQLKVDDESGSMLSGVEYLESGRVPSPGSGGSDNGMPLPALDSIPEDGDQNGQQSVPPQTLPSAPKTLPSAPKTLPSAPKTLPSAPKTLPSASETQPSAHQNILTWRIDLTSTQEYWTQWFQGLSGKFLATAAPKLLLLAGVDRLDKELTVGQMQGKFQMQVLPQCGHAVHEDVPDKVSDAVATFLVRNKFVPPSDNFNRVFPSC